jgi:hypothetical protein
MSVFLDQAGHNLNFHSHIDSNFEKKFCDWQITVLFYVALHLLKALAASRSVNIGETHYDIENSVNPDRGNPVMRISRGAWREYKSLFNYSRTARYEGITDFETFQLLKEKDHDFCLIHLDNFRKYIESQGVVLE